MFIHLKRFTSFWYTSQSLLASFKPNNKNHSFPLPMGAASKLLLLLTSPFPLLYHGRSSAIRHLLLPSRISAVTLPFLPDQTFSSACSPHLQLGRGFFAVSNSSQQQQVHTTSVNVGDNFHPDYSHYSSTFSEWSNLLDALRHAGYFNNQPVSMQLIGDDALSAVENLPQDFVLAASACLSFARRYPHLLLTLSRKDIEIIVQNGSPFLFKCAMDSTKRMRSFLGGTQNSELVFEGADLGDLMRFLLSYVYDSVVSDQNNLASGELVESSMCRLLRQLACESRHIQEPSLSSVPNQLPSEYGQASRPLRQNIEMKPGDWICPKCMFMNFARNMKCLECDETRPKRQLTGVEWDCPQCNFFNYGRNVVCLRCDCKRPGEAFGSAAPSFRSGYNSGNKADAFNRTAPLEQRRTNAQYQGNLGNVGTPEHSNFESINGTDPGKSSGVAVNQSLDRILGRTSEASKYEHVSSNLLPSEMFIKSEQVTNNNGIAATGFSHLNPSGSSDGLPHSRKPVNQTENKEDEGQAEKTERWFKKIEELDDIATNLPSAISDEDFPEIMPMRKGENRFVVRKKRERPVTSPLQKRQMAMEQTNNGTNFVPFVPFPPDYFAKKDKVPESEASPGKEISGTSAFAKPELQGEMGRFGEQNSRVLDSGAFVNSVQSSENQLSMKEGMDTSFPGNTRSDSRVNYSYQMPSGNSTEAASNVWTGSRHNGNSSSWEENRSSSTSPTGNSTQQSVNTNNTTDRWRGGFSGMSLEGSLVKEPDPLDMSEEAKAERWFRRAAQIKDISELSQIPDEDFPQIMPMRKGVNRFVVSKRKTPLERRLTSPQYRRNLPTVSSDPTKKENTES